MKLRELLSGVSVLACTADMEMEISGVSYDSRSVRPGDLFVAMTGFAVDGHKFIAAAQEKGAAAALCQKEPGGTLPYVRTEDSRRALAIVGANWFGHPAKEMTMVAVTGTCGKTTTTYLLKAILEQAAGAKVGLIGTNQNMIGNAALPTDRTTPESFEVQKLFREMADAGCTHVVMETSSHALYLDRVYGVHYDVGVFTNLTQDHLDFHKTMESYCDAKAILFRNCSVGVVNADDPWTPRLLKDAACRVMTYAERAKADLRAEHIALSADGIAFDAVTETERVPVRVHIPGGFMVYNTLDVLGAALALGIPLKDSAAVLAGQRPADSEGVCQGPYRSGVRLRRRPGPDEAASDGKGCGGLVGFCCGYHGQSTDGAAGGYYRGDSAGLCRQCNALSGGGGPGGGHPLGHGPCTEGGRHRSVRQGS